MLKKFAYLIIIIVGVYVLLGIQSVSDFADNLKASVLGKVGNVTEEYKRVKDKVEDVSNKAKETKEKVDETINTVNNTIDTVNEAVDGITETADKIGNVFGGEEEETPAEQEAGPSPEGTEED